MVIKIKEKEYKLKKDRYKQARSGCSRLFNIHCRKCNNIVVVYQKDGIGTVLRRLYMDRILAPKNLVGLQKQILKKISVVTCETCGHILGMPYIYKKEKRKSFRLHKDSIIKTIKKLDK